MRYYNRTNACDVCKVEKLKPGYAYRELDKNGDWTGRWICKKCQSKKYEYGIYEKPIKIYNDTNTCDICGISFENLGWSHPHRDYDKKGNWTGKWICNKCSSKECLIAGSRRTGNLNPNSAAAKGDDFEELTYRWKGAKILSKENDCYNGPLDHSADSEGKIPQTKGKWYDSYNRYWHQNLKSEHNAIRREFKFDYLILYCASKYGKIIERIYVFPIEELLKRTGITIIKNPSNRNGRCPTGGWYEQYRVKDEEVMNKVNEIWKEIISGK